MLPGKQYDADSWEITLHVAIKSHYDQIILNGVELNSSKEEKLLGVLIDKNLSFDNHIKSGCRMAIRKTVLLLD